MIEIKELNKTYTQGSSKITALKNISLNIGRGEQVAIVGPSGSGKTTLLSLIAGLERASHGQITINGQVTSSFDEKSYSRFRSQNMAIVFQQFHLMPHLSALENVSLPLEILKQQHPEQKALEALEDVGLKNRIDHLPGQLSGGECQRVALARALVVNPQILLADEPSGNLDTETGLKVMDLFLRLVQKHKTTLVLITHDKQLANRFKRQIHLNSGEITS